MDHRWDELLQAEHQRRIEAGRYDAYSPVSDADVARRDQLALARQRVNRSPWEIGASHWNQRDLYTRNARTDAAGYARGPSLHPSVGSYAYHREFVPTNEGQERQPGSEVASLYEREADPWLNYELVQPAEHEEGMWDRVKRSLSGAAHTGLTSIDESIQSEVEEALRDHASLDATDIDVAVKHGEVTLEGTVLDSASKNLAETLSKRCNDVHVVHNHLSVRDGGDGDLGFTSPIIV